MMINCPECGKEISDKAISCPNCGYVLKTDVQSVSFKEKRQKKQRRQKKDSALSLFAAMLSLFTWTWWIGLIFAIIDIAKSKNDRKRHIGSWFAIVFAIIYAIMLIDTSGKDAQNATSKPVAVQSKNDALDNETENNETANTEPAESEISVGGQFECDGLVITINSADTDFTEYDDEYGFYELENGKKYIQVSFTYENSGDSDRYVSIYDYDCYADGTLCDQSYNFGGDFVNANISPNRNVSFETYYIVPKDSKDIELEYKENIWTDDKVIIKVE